MCQKLESIESLAKEQTQQQSGINDKLIFLKEKNAAIVASVVSSPSSLSKILRQTDCKNWEFWTDRRAGLVVEVMISSPLPK